MSTQPMVTASATPQRRILPPTNGGTAPFNCWHRTQARMEALQPPAIAQAKSREALAPAPTAEAEARFMQQLYEMNAGLLA